uniref:Uncharacterized protein LOC111122621 n=1 Tax=Crassostrea virginica TaxID=6565 RepID=A0A8B8D051_CRAVI|nr:uncharacterized protein LOC111122621 [Crassostrea virginica]XP_022320141.1 uncharacterized protein LOC111122621 [Crassostrea virginica]XP_022320142.1 uncharacterized protein LOC111122621 [Crassostrea virginica]XP_022320143.1 uncharacterized protein LOC111122621 [Crassostrea virginica]XP_022320144.1 uncharacterized protein LOC111122621 [Crassostrea virginica]XP_022320145.1 uncharacterized protein LOC111122621 [Crassostrea virginica]
MDQTIVVMTVEEDKALRHRIHLKKKMDSQEKIILDEIKKTKQKMDTHEKKVLDYVDKVQKVQKKMDTHDKNVLDYMKKVQRKTNTKDKNVAAYIERMQKKVASHEPNGPVIWIDIKKEVTEVFQQTIEEKIENMAKKFKEIMEMRQEHEPILDHRREACSDELDKIEKTLKDFNEKEIKHGQETLNEDLDEMKSRLRDFNEKHQRMKEETEEKKLVEMAKSIQGEQQQKEKDKEAREELEMVNSLDKTLLEKFESVEITLLEMVLFVKKELLKTMKSVKEKIEMANTILYVTNEECEIYLEGKYSLFLACRIVQAFAAGLLIAAGIMVSNATSCQLEEALQSFDLMNEKFFCKHYAIKNTPALWIIGIIVLASNTINIVLCVCQCCYRCCYKCWEKCIRYNRFCEYTRHKWTVVLTYCISASSAISLFWIVLVYFIEEDIKEPVIDYVNLRSSMISSLKTSFTSDDINSGNGISNAWNKLFIKYDCCAVNEVLGTTNDFDETPWCTTSGTCQATASQIPKSCCNDVTENNYQSAPSACHASVNSGTYKSNCLSRMKELSTENIQGHHITLIFRLVQFIVIVQVLDIYLLIEPLNTWCKKRRISTVRNTKIDPQKKD